MTLMQAEPTAEHAAHFARLAHIASDGFFSLLLGSRAPIALESMFRRRDNDSSHRYTTFLREGESVAAMLQAYPAAAARLHAGRTGWLYLRYAAWQTPRLLALGFVLRDILAFVGSNLEADDFYIAMLAVYPAFRRRGYSKTLLREAERLAAADGCSRLTLDVDERNEIARAAYRSAGFETISESRRDSGSGRKLGAIAPGEAARA